MLPESSESTVFPTKARISACSPLPIIPSSMTLAFRSLFDLHQAHPAVGGDRELLVIAEMRDVDPQAVGGLHHGGAVSDFGLPAVDRDFGHGVSGRLPHGDAGRGGISGNRHHA